MSSVPRPNDDNLLAETHFVETQPHATSDPATSDPDEVSAQAENPDVQDSRRATSFRSPGRLSDRASGRSGGRPSGRDGTTRLRHGSGGESQRTGAAATAVLTGGRKGVVAARVAVASDAGAASVEHFRSAAALPAPVDRTSGDRVGPGDQADASTSVEPGECIDGPAAARSAEWPANRETAQRSLERRIRAHLMRGDLTVILTDNRYTMISVRRESKGSKHFKVRLHHMFAHASPMITRALARYIANNDRDASRALGDFIDAHQHRVRTSSRSRSAPRLVTQGRIHDLRDIFDHINQRYFNGTIEARITWGQRIGKPRRRNSIKMGSYSVEDKLIRIHRSLDRPFVPRFFVEWVVFHEMLHQVHDIKVVNGRRRFHSREFLRDEATFEFYAESRAWERANLDALLTC